MLNFFYKIVVLPNKVKQFFTPKSYNQNDREVSFEKSSKKEEVYISSIKKSICVYSYGYSKQKVLLVHGWSGRGTQFYRIADKLLENKKMVMYFDAPAHGLSPGNTTHLFEFVEIIKHFQNQNCYAVVAHSLGASATLHFQGLHHYFKKMVLIGILTDSNKAISQLVKPKYVNSFKQQAEEKFKIRMDDFNGIHSAKAINTPTLLIHDTYDKQVTVNNAIDLRLSLRNATLWITQNLGHTKILKSVKVVNRISQFLTDE